MFGSCRILVLAFVAFFALSLFGCAGDKAVNSTVAVREVTRGESEQHVTYSLIPGDLTDDPALAGKVLAIPTVPGKDIEFAWYYPDGTPRVKLATKRSAVIDALLTNINTIDGAKFAEDALRREWVSQERAAWFAEFQQFVPMMQQRLTPAPPSVPTWKALLADPEALKALRDAIAPQPPKP